MSFDYSGSFSGSFFGEITSSNGVISSSAQVISNLPYNAHIEIYFIWIIISR